MKLHNFYYTVFESICFYVTCILLHIKLYLLILSVFKFHQERFMQTHEVGIFCGLKITCECHRHTHAKHLQVHEYEFTDSPSVGPAPLSAQCSCSDPGL